MDFSKYELSEELRATLTKDYAADVAGLKNKRDDLIGREKSLKEANEALTLEMSTSAENAKVLLAEKEGSVEQYKNAVLERDQKIETIQREFKEEKDARTLSDAVNDFSTGLVDDPAGKMYMQSLFKNSVEVKDGLIVSKDTTKTIEELKLSLVADKANAKYIKAEVGSGLGSQGSQVITNTVSETKNVKAEAASKSGDTLGFIQASLNQ